MPEQSPQIVGITGGSCAGKTWLADRLQSEFGERAARLSQDDFYLDRSYLPAGRRARLNFDHPRAIDWKRLEKTLGQFARGRVASVPRYDFATHGRLNGDAELNPAAILIVEGLWLFRGARLRSLFDLKVFIRSTPELCTKRRLERDTAERGRTREQVMQQLSRYTLPMSERFVAPQERWADVVLKAPVGEREILEVLNRIEARNAELTVGI
ncbi:MAG: uridine kinase family protein [Limisphaerales bacterium]